MRIHEVLPPRSFEVGHRGMQLRHVADVELEPDEQVTFTTPSGTEWDAVRKSWGYYATPSLNGRLAEHGLRACLAVGQPREEGLSPRAYVLLVERGREQEFDEYMRAEGMRVAAWLDGDEAVADAARRLGQ